MKIDIGGMCGKQTFEVCLHFIYGSVISIACLCLLGGCWSCGYWSSRGAVFTPRDSELKYKHDLEVEKLKLHQEILKRQ